ncbi:MAG: fructosamine kinase family protein, partial [Ilumatobacteraceae bacterium]
MDALRAAVADAVGQRVERMAVVRGGDVASSFRVDLHDGTHLFAKTHPAPPAGFFTTEAASLSWLRDAAAVAIPSVVAVSDGAGSAPAFLVLEWIEAGRPGPSTERALGTALAALHDAGAPCFGRDDRRTTGSRGLPNDPQPDWPAFYG